MATAARKTDPWAEFADPVDISAEPAPAAPLEANNGSTFRAPVAGRAYTIEDAVQELGMTPQQAQQFVATGKDPRTPPADDFAALGDQVDAPAAPAKEPPQPVLAHGSDPDGNPAPLPGYAVDEHGRVILDPSGAVEGGKVAADTGIIGEKGGSHLESDPTKRGVNATVNAMLKARAPLRDIAAYLKGKGYSDTWILGTMHQAADIRAWQDKYPQYKGDYHVDLERFAEPNTTWQNFANSDVGVGAGSAADAATGFNTDSIIGLTGGDAEEARQALARSQAAHPKSALTGTIAGGVTGSLVAEEAAARAGLKGVPKAIAADVGYGFPAGMGATDYNAEGEPATIKDRLIGGAEGTVAAMGGRAVGSAMAAGVGAGRSPDAPLTQAQEIGQAAERQNMDLLPADVGGPGTRRASSVLSQTIAGGTPIVNAAKRVIEQGKAVRDRVATAIGKPANAEAAGEVAYQGALKYKNSSRSRIGRMYDIAATEARNDAGEEIVIPLHHALNVVDEQIERLSKVPGKITRDVDGEEFLSADLRELAQFRRSLEGEFTVQGVRDMRTEMFVAPEFRGTPTERRLGQIVDAAADDIREGLVKAGKPKAAQIFAEADRQWRERLTTMKRVIEPIIGKSEDAAKSGEDIIRGLERAAKGQGRRFEKFMRTLPEEDAAVVRASLISRMGQATAGRQGAAGTDFSLSEFLTHWNQMGERAKAVTFGPEGRAALNDLALVAQGSKEAQRYHNISQTFGGVGNFLTAATGLAGFPAFLKIVGAQYGLGRLLASPRFARWLARVPKAKDVSYFNRLNNIAEAEPGIAGDIRSLQARLADAFHTARKSEVTKRVLKTGGAATGVAGANQH